MRSKQAKLVASFLFWGFLVLSSATEDLLVVSQCKNQCKHDLHNMKECEDRCDKKMMMMMMDQEEGIYQSCMTACPRSIQETMATGKQDEGRGYGPLKTKCNGNCSSPYTSRKRCISQCLKSLVGKKKMDNEVTCESSCSILQEEPLIVRCTRVCHERTPGAVDLVLLEK
ncbi:unnamed protein product [Eruca vesicaria subsp. sativa]|uniref:Uncharacterized protein n=1 Tax=Eruca vesicaria subsp. sativa TaxID=29727 RepID=A0ABC8JI92_ERUVS|nr:unnamed protein product [Eruca vesicaria subsp. sativa]